MKKFIEGRWFPLIVAVIAAVIAALIMTLFGWKLTYAPDLENSWDAVSAFAAWVGVIMSFLAILVAGYVALKQIEISRIQADISDKQNKIALFDKRFSVYETARKCVHTANRISEIAKNLDDVYDIFYVEFIGQQSLNPADIENKNTALFFDITDVLLQSEFLFSSEISEKICSMSACLLLLAAIKYRDNPDEIFESAKDRFCQCAKGIDSSNIFKLIKRDLQLQSVDLQG